MKTLLHVGCGPLNISSIPFITDPENWKEYRLDIDMEHEPDFLCSMTDMKCVPDNSIDCVYSSHNIEHLFPFQVPIALSEFYRVLREGGTLIATCPDVEAVARHIIDKGLIAPAYYLDEDVSINALDMLYGWTEATQNGNHFMAHKCGFTKESLEHELKCADFDCVKVYTADFDLVSIATK